jgi:hypothetical protein
VSDPLIDPSDLGTYLNDTTINEARAEMLIGQAQALCESIVSPLPEIASVVVMRVAGRAYVSTTSTRNAQMAAAGSPFGGVPAGMGGVMLTRSDRADLRRLAGGSGGAFSIDVLPANYVAPVPWRPVDDWDTQA